MRRAFSGGGDHLSGKYPWVSTALAARVDDAEAGGVEAAAFVGSGPERNVACDDGMAQGALSVVVRGRQPRIIDKCHDGIPVVEDFPSQCPHLFLDFPLVALA